MKALLILLISFSAQAIQLVDVDGPGVEIRSLMFLHKEGAKIRLDVCKHPEKTVGAACEGGIAGSAVMDPDGYESRLRLFYRQGEYATYAGEREDKTAALLWTRKRIRDEVESGALEASAKDKLENLLNEMVFALDESEIRKVQEARHRAFEEVTKLVSAGSAAPVFRGVESEKYEALFSPFRAFFERTLCRCESTLVESAMPVARCVLRKGTKILAWAEGTAGDCTTRAQCRARPWFQEDMKTALQFQKLTEQACGDYFAAGSWKTPVP